MNTPETVNSTSYVPPLFGVRIADKLVKKETPKHRLIFLLKAQGLTNVDVAAAVGCSVNTVSRIVSQPWFQRRIVKYLHEQGDNAVKKLLQVHAPEAVAVALGLMRSAKSEQVRATCALKFIGLQVGQKIEITPPTENLDKVDAEIEKLEQEIRELTGGLRGEN